MPRTPSIPPYRLHKPSGQAVATFSGRTHYLGKFNSRESRDKYAALLAQWNAAGQQLPPRGAAALTIAQLCVAFLKHAEAFYCRADGTPTGESENLRFALRPLNRLYARLPAEEFSPLKLRAVREEMIKLGWVRTNINHQVHRIRGMFRWAESHEILPPGCHVYETLKAGRSKAAESKPVEPVAAAMIEAVLPLVSRQVGTMIRLQLLTGMRPAEVCMMRTADVAVGAEVWAYSPLTHKTAYRGKRRVIHLGPQAQEILRPWLREPARREEFLFSPAEAEGERLAALTSQEPRRPSQIQRAAHRRGRRRQRPAGNRYDVSAYRRAIARACDQAFELPAELAETLRAARKWVNKWSYENDRRPRRSELPVEIREGLDAVEAHRAKFRWSPNQIRHNTATELRKRFGIEGASVVLGHATPAVTAIYAEQDQGKAARIMGEVG